MGIRQMKNTNNKQSNISSYRKRSKVEHASQAYTNSTNNSNYNNNETSTDQVFQQSINQLQNEIQQLVHDPNMVFLNQEMTSDFIINQQMIQNNHLS